MLYEATGLGEGSHTLNIVATGERGTPASQGAFVSVDAIDTDPSPEQAAPAAAAAYPQVPQKQGTASRDAAGALVADLPGPAETALQALDKWRSAKFDPERAVEYDDSGGTKVARGRDPRALWRELNVLRLHFSDSLGFRIESESHPGS